MAYDQVGQERKLKLQVLEELHLEAYENSWIYKEKVKQFHDNRILRKEFRVSQKVLLFRSRLKLIAGKIHSKWNEPFVITNKCHFMVTEGIILGHLVSNRGIEVDKAKIDIIASLSHPAFVREVRSFLGNAGFYKRFIQNFSKIALPLSKLLQQDVEFVFDQPCIEAFQELKKRLTTTPIFQAPDWELPFELMCDPSNLALGAILGQQVGKHSHVIAYASCTLDSTQANYTTTKKELLAFVFALDKFRSYLLGSKIVIFSGHVAFKFLLKKPDAKLRLIRWMLLLQEFDIKIRDKSDVENLVVGHLSKIERRIDPLPIRDDFPYEQLMQLDDINPWFANIVNYLVASILPLEASRSYKDKIKSDAKYYMWDDPYLWKFCSGQTGIMGHIKQLGRYWIVDFISLPFLGMPITLLPLASNVKELEWPLPIGMRCPSTPFFFVRWVEAKATKTNDAKVIVDFVRSNIFCKFGVPKALISGQGSHFCNKTMSTLLEKYGAMHRVATAYHPQTNGQVKVFNKEIKQILQKVANPNRKDWSWLLEDAL
ncbi:Retrovirus-related Pol polyprotein from transposon 17.6, partial [Mucuna pruriens]